MTTPRAFISYSHDSPEHKHWVLEFATKLRASGVDAVLDLWELQPGDDLPAFMERNLSTADRVIMICTDKYVLKANAGTGGVGYEKMIVTADLAASIDSNKVIPIIRQAGTRHVPTFLRTKLFIDFSRAEQYEFAFDELVRTIHKAPLYVKPDVGHRPDFTEPTPPPKTGDPILVLITVAVSEFESNPGTEYLPYVNLAKRAQQKGMSRLYFDAVLSDVLRLGLLKRVEQFILFTPSGKKFALENNLA